MAVENECALDFGVGIPHVLWLFRRPNRVSGPVKRIRVKVAVKKAVKCSRKCKKGAKHTLKRTLRRTFNRVTYLDTLNRPT